MFVCSSPTIGIFLYIAPAVEHVLSVAFGKNLCWFEFHYRHISLCSPGSITRAISSLRKKHGFSRPINGIFVYVDQAVESVLAVAFGIHKTHKRQTSIPPLECEPTISADEIS